ncbi:hypothetical protein Aperf_G00000045402 [Anoplocephala perfoliata]
MFFFRAQSRFFRFLQSARKFQRYSYLAAAPAIFFPVLCESTQSGPTFRSPELPRIFPVISLTQLQLDATVSLVSQLLLDLENQIATLSQLESAQHNVFQQVSTDPNNPTLQDKLVSIRNEWNACLTRCVDLEYSLETAFVTLEHSLNLAVLVTPLFSTDSLSMLDRTGTLLDLLRKTFETLKKEHGRLVQTWNAHISENIRSMPTE